MSEKSKSINTISYTSIEQIGIKVGRQKEFFRKGLTKPIEERKISLKRLLKEIEAREDAIMKALYLDFQKSNFETFETEIGLVKSELKYAIKKLRKWNAKSFEGFSLLSYPARMYSEPLPLGNTLIISPWNYPFMLSMSPLIGAVAAGNTALIKPSELTLHTSEIIEEIISHSFDPGHVDVVQGAVKESEAILEYPFDFVFFTGSTGVGNIVYKKAAEHLCPVMLELGGKSPCIVNLDADIEIAAKRIVWGKFLNGGQTCVAPDYLLIHRGVKDQLVERIVYYIKKFYGEDAQQSPDYPRIISDKHFDRLKSLLSDGNLLFGGNSSKEELYIEPTIIELDNTAGLLMKEEIFGPILPILVFDSLMDINKTIQENANPLALYVFADDENFAAEVLANNPSGDACINDVVSHFGEKKIGVGGIASSGFGKYHGKKSFEAFSHRRSILKRSIWPDLPLRYPPYKNKLGLLKAILNKV